MNNKNLKKHSLRVSANKCDCLLCLSLWKMIHFPPNSVHATQNDVWRWRFERDIKHEYKILFSPTVTSTLKIVFSQNLVFAKSSETDFSKYLSNLLIYGKTMQNLIEKNPILCQNKFTIIFWLQYIILQKWGNMLIFINFIFFFRNTYNIEYDQHLFITTLFKILPDNYIYSITLLL